jgi:hypothetical protein
MPFAYQRHFRVRGIKSYLLATSKGSTNLYTIKGTELLAVLIMDETIGEQQKGRNVT